MSGSLQSRARKGAALLLLLVAVVACGNSSKPSPTPSPSGTTQGWRQFTDRTGGFSIQYPDSWNRYQPNEATVRFYAGPNDKDGVVVRVIGLGATVNPGDTQVMKQVADRILAQSSVNIVRENQVTVGGLPGWEYVYTFQDPAGTGVHVHVFLFQGSRLHILVFQALPESRLTALAGTFDKILASYRALPLPSGSETGSGSTTASGTPAPASPTATATH